MGDITKQGRKEVIKTEKEVKKRAIDKAKRDFLKPTLLMDIHFNGSCFFQDVILWGLRPMRVVLDVIDNILWEDEDADILPLLNDLKTKVDEFIVHMERWDEEVMVERKKEAA